MSNQTLSKQTLVGGWTTYESLTIVDRKVFNEATKNGKILGVNYTPEKVATQVVAGMNYRFKCDASLSPSEVIWQAIIVIYQPLDGKAHIVSITRL
ncbi:hypothetical protein [Tenacibaculum amylolyticum]|uniref:hypothetical protein n=1 Tax=Tenacibaculum amylolyticum TaxID=104269 RepID=UPI003895BCC1